MAIQFPCTNCGQPIEVDEQHAGQTAACPYCRHLVVVPESSTYDPNAAVTARPTEAEAPVPTPMQPPPLPGEQYAVVDETALTRQRRAAATIGNFGLACAGIVVALFLGTMGYSMYLGAKNAMSDQGKNVTMEEQMSMLENSPAVVWLGVGSCGMLFFGIAGIILGAISLAQDRTANWRGWVAIIVCGGMLLCFGGVAVIGNLVMGGG